MNFPYASEIHSSLKADDDGSSSDKEEDNDVN